MVALRWRRSAEAEERQDRHEDDNQSDEINDAVHEPSPEILRKLTGQFHKGSEATFRISPVEECGAEHWRHVARELDVLAASLRSQVLRQQSLPAVRRRWDF
jgi:hypothetical protein